MFNPVSRSLRRSRRDVEAFSRFYGDHVDQLVGYFMYRVNDAEVALDLTAEVMARAFTKRASYRGSTDKAAAAWLYTIAARELANYHRRQAVEKKALRKLQLERAEPTEDSELQLVEREAVAELLASLGDGLAALPQAQREIVELRYYRELSYGEISDRVGISSGAARIRMMRALQALRKSFQATKKEEIA